MAGKDVCESTALPPGHAKSSTEVESPALRPSPPTRVGRWVFPRLWSLGLGQNLRRLRPDRLEISVLLVLSLAAVYQLFVEPIVGIADNRDFARLMDPAGLDYPSVASYRESVFQFVETKFVSAKVYTYRYLTSERPILGIARLLNRLVSKDGKFDVRSLGFCNLALYVGAVFILLRAFRSAGLARRLLVAGSVLLICTDVGLAAYFNSFYCESASIIFMFSTLGLALLCIQGARQGPTAWLLWAGYMGSSFLFWTAKSQNIAFAPCLVLGAWCFFPCSRLRGRSYLRVIGTAAIPVAVVWAFAVGAYGDTVPANAQVVLAEEILPHSPRPAADRQELGAETGGPTLYRVARFYAHHPIRWWQMSQRQAKEAFGYPLLGNFSRESGLGPRAQSQAFNLWSELKKAHYPRNLTSLIGFLTTYCILAGMKARWLDRGRVARMTTLVGPVLGLGSALEFVATVTFEANGTAKHLFIFNVAVDICLLLALLSLADAAAQRRRRWVTA